MFFLRRKKLSEPKATTPTQRFLSDLYELVAQLLVRTRHGQQDRFGLTSMMGELILLHRELCVNSSWFILTNMINQYVIAMAEIQKGAVATTNSEKIVVAHPWLLEKSCSQFPHDIWTHHPYQSIRYGAPLHGSPPRHRDMWFGCHCHQNPWIGFPFVVPSARHFWHVPGMHSQYVNEKTKREWMNKKHRNLKQHEKKAHTLF